MAYQVVYLTAFALGKAVVAKACWFYARLTEDVWVRRGLRTAVVGACLDLVYSLGRFADVFLVHRGWDPSAWATVTRTCLTVGLTLNTIGWTAPLWGSRVQGSRRGGPTTAASGGCARSGTPCTGPTPKCPCNPLPQ